MSESNLKDKKIVTCIFQNRAKGPWGNLQGCRPAPAKIWQYQCMCHFLRQLLLHFCRFEHYCETMDETSPTLSEIGNVNIWIFNERNRRSHSSKRNKKKWILCQTSGSQRVCTRLIQMFLASLFKTHPSEIHVNDALLLHFVCFEMASLKYSV